MAISVLTDGVPRVSAPSHDDFTRHYLKPGIPVILQDLMRDWPACTRWTPEYLLDVVGDKPVVSQTSPTGLFGLHPERGGPRYEERPMALRAFIEQIRTPAPHDIHLYMQRLSIPDLLPELMGDIALPPYVQSQQVYLLNLWFGPAGNVTQLHYDVPNNFLAQVRGRKRLILFAPSQTACLYPYTTKAYNMSRVDIEQPDLATYPRFSRARPLEVLLEPGEILFLPPFWWHQVYSVELGMSVNVWWTPLWRQLIAPQIFANIPDIARALRGMAVGRLRALLGQTAARKGDPAHA